MSVARFAVLALALQGAVAVELKAAATPQWADKGVPYSNAVVHPEVQSTVDARSAHDAAESTVKAAAVANTVAERSVEAAKKTSEALKQAHDVIHMARVQATKISPSAAASLFKAEKHLEGADVGQASNKSKGPNNELNSMQAELRDLRGQLKDCGKGQDKSVAQMDTELRELQDMLSTLESAEANGPQNTAGHHELEIEIQHLRESIGRLEKFGSHSVRLPEAPKVERTEGDLRYRMQVHKPHPRVQLTPLADIQSDAVASVTADLGTVPSPCPPSSIDIDTDMPYGELEPFGREDTAQELTESSLRESDEMVDQIERAEVSEEKRAVFRALTRLRGAAITSYDGVARSQTGNIDEYNKVHKWRMTHPLRHLADEESDISKWAFPDNADF
jgi:hypothetical protein